MTQWPDPNKPGYPVNASEDGWHWISIAKERPVVKQWFGGTAGWLEYTSVLYPDQVTHWQYLGPAAPYADAFTAGARAARDQAVEWLEEVNAVSAADAIQSLPLPNAAPKNAANTGENLSASVDLSQLEALADLWERGEDEWVDADSCCLKLLRSCKNELRAEIAKLKGK